MYEFLFDLDKEYKKAGYNFEKALEVWEEEKLSADDIRNTIYSDIQKEITYPQAKLLQMSRLKIAECFKKAEEEIGVEQKETQKLSSRPVIRITPAVKRMVEKIGANTYKSKYGSVQWSIVLIEGEPHLARKEVEDTDREEKLADNE